MTFRKQLAVLAILGHRHPERTNGPEIVSLSDGEIVQGTQVVILEVLEEQGLVASHKPTEVMGSSLTMYSLTSRGIETLEEFGVKWAPKQAVRLSVS